MYAGPWEALHAYTPEAYPDRRTASGITSVADALAPLVGGLLSVIPLVATLTMYVGAFLVGGLAVVGAGRRESWPRLDPSVRRPQALISLADQIQALQRLSWPLRSPWQARVTP